MKLSLPLPVPVPLKLGLTESKVLKKKPLLSLKVCSQKETVLILVGRLALLLERYLMISTEINKTIRIINRSYSIWTSHWGLWLQAGWCADQCLAISSPAPHSLRDCLSRKLMKTMSMYSRKTSSMYLYTEIYQTLKMQKVVNRPRRQSPA